MSPHDIEPRPRCTVLCEEADTGCVIRCARWEGHKPEDAHDTYHSVIVAMVEALCVTRGTDIESISNTMQAVTVLNEAQMWYRRLVVQ